MGGGEGSVGVLWAQPHSGPLPHPTHSKQAAHLAQGSTAPWIVDEANVAFRGAIGFQDPNGAKALLKGLPHICPESIAHCQADCMCPVLWSLQGHPKKDEEEVTSSVPRNSYLQRLSFHLYLGGD